MRQTIFQQLEEKTAEQCVPWHAFIEITRFCNQRCRHCYHDNLSGPHMEQSLFNRCLAELSSAGAMFVTLSGGEPLTHPDICEFLRAATAAGFVISLLTNGSLLSEEMVRQLTITNVTSVAVTLFSASAPIHDRLTTVAGSWQGAVEGIDRCLRKGIRVEVRAPILAENIAGFDQLAQWCEKRQITFRPDPLITPRNSGDPEPLTLQAADDLLASWFDSAEPTQRPGGMHGDNLFCDAGRNYLAIDVEGWVLPCIQWPLRVARVGDMPLLKLWNQSPILNEIRNLTVADLTECSDCCYVSHCDRCPGLAQIESGDLRGPSPGCCRLTRLHMIEPEKGMDKNETSGTA